MRTAKTDEWVKGLDVDASWSSDLDLSVVETLGRGLDLVAGFGIVWQGQDLRKPKVGGVLAGSRT